MNGPLVDTSVLVDYFAGRASPEADLLQALFEDGPDPAIAPIIRQEFLQGVSRDVDIAPAQEYLDRFVQLPPADYAVHERAVVLHRALRRRGITAGTVDTLIVAMAEQAGLPLLSDDRLQIRLCAEAGIVAL